MAKFAPLISLLLVLGIFQSLVPGEVSAVTFTFINGCDKTVWPVILSNAGIEPFLPTGFALAKGESKLLTAPLYWRGQIWGRTDCSKNSNGVFTCVTGNCGTRAIECIGGAATSPATLAEFTLGVSDGRVDLFDVSFVLGFNLPMVIFPLGGSGGNCTYTGCMKEINGVCPSALKVIDSDGKTVACNSACVAFGRQDYCCSGAYSTRDACKPPPYSNVFKTVCPRATSYFYGTTTFSCTGADYAVTFCTRKRSNEVGTGAPQFTNIEAILAVVVFVVAVVGLGAAGYAIKTGNIHICNGSCNNCF